MRWAVVTFPGSTCDTDCARVLREILGQSVDLIRHDAATLGEAEIVVLPGGFSFGDHLRPGALAARAPIMAEVQRYAARGGTLLGICNGFQVLCEAGLLPGALRRNEGGRFVCREVEVEIGGRPSRFSRGLQGRTLRLPIAHDAGNYHVDPDAYARLEPAGAFPLRYRGENPNGSAGAVAGVLNAAGNVFGLMPHPERACEPLLGSADGRLLFEALLDP